MDTREFGKRLDTGIRDITTPKLTFESFRIYTWRGFLLSLFSIPTSGEHLGDEYFDILILNSLSREVLPHLHLISVV
jgi:hypothetical protein